MTRRAILHLARPSFWPEPREPEAWLRILADYARYVSTQDALPITGPRAAWERALSKKLSRRSVHGLFGLDVEGNPPMLHGAGLLVRSGETTGWRLSAEAAEILASWREGTTKVALEALAAHLLRSSAWLRLLLAKVAQGQWRLLDWDRARETNIQLSGRTHVDAGDDVDPEYWTRGIERVCLGAWARRKDLEGVQVVPRIRETVKKEDGFSWAPLKGPLYLLDSLGWMDTRGQLKLPTALERDEDLEALQVSVGSPSGLLRQATQSLADVRGFSPVEPVMRSLATRAGLEEHVGGARFERWMDLLLGEALRVGAVELHAAEPGQARHGRGLLGDRERKLIRWSIHDDFDAVFGAVMGDLAREGTPKDEHAAESLT